MTICDFLKQNREPCPRWLLEHSIGEKPTFEQFFESRIVFYQGSGSDGHAVKLFGSSHSSHTFIYADYQYPKQAILGDLSGRGRFPYNSPFLGYCLLDRIDLRIEDLMPSGLSWHISPPDAPKHPTGFSPYGLLVILERETGYDDSHGPERIAILFLGADGIATYDVLFCQDIKRAAPYAIIINDLGVQRNYSSFGQRGYLYELVQKTDVRPQYLLVDEQNTSPWPNYLKIEGVQADTGGMHDTPRHLYKRTE